MTSEEKLLASLNDRTDAVAGQEINHRISSEKYPDGGEIAVLRKAFAELLRRYKLHFPHEDFSFFTEFDTYNEEAEATKAEVKEENAN